MQNLIDPITADLIFTCLSSAVLLAGLTSAQASTEFNFKVHGAPLAA